MYYVYCIFIYLFTKTYGLQVILLHTSWHSSSSKSYMDIKLHYLFWAGPQLFLNQSETDTSRHR